MEELLKIFKDAYDSGLLQLTGAVAFILWSLAVGWGIKVVHDMKKELIIEIKSLREVVVVQEKE